MRTDDDLPPSEAETIDAFASHLRLERHLSGHTVTAYRRDISQLATFLDRQGRSLGSATYLLLRRFPPDSRNSVVALSVCCALRASRPMRRTIFSSAATVNVKGRRI